MSTHKPAKKTEKADLSSSQRQVVETWGKGVAVLAGAGSGKTGPNGGHIE